MSLGPGQASLHLPTLIQKSGALLFTFLKQNPYAQKHQSSRNAAGSRTRLRLFNAGLASLCLDPLQILATRSAELQLATSGEGAAAVVGIWEGGTWGGGTGRSCRGCRSSALIKEEFHFFAAVLCCSNK